MAQITSRVRSFAKAFSTLRTETPSIPVTVQGRMPAWLAGHLFRTAPAIFEVGGRSMNHWFDGYAMLYSFGFGAGAVTFASRLLRGRTYEAAEATGTMPHGAFATDPGPILLGGIAARFRPDQTDNGNVSVGMFGGCLVALTETPLPIRFDPETLETLGVYGYRRDLSAAQVSMAHPHFDAGRRCHYSYVLEFGRRCFYRVFSIDDRTGLQTPLTHLDVPRPAYMHSIGMSDRYLVLAEFPLVVAPMRLLFSGQPFIRNYRWEPGRNLRFRVIEKDTGTVVKTVEAAAAFGFHHVNAFEERDTLCVDLITFPDTAIIDQLTLKRLRAGASVNAVGDLVRYRIPLGPGDRVESQRLTETKVELPRIHYRSRAGQPHRWVWGTGCRSAGNFFDSIVKVDVTTGITLTWHEADCYPGEPVFTARPDGRGEDDGVILSVVFDGGRETSFLLVLDAATLEELARAEAPQRLPIGFHGEFFPDLPAAPAPVAAA